MKIHPIQPIALVILIVVFWYFRKKSAPQGPAKAGPMGAPRAAVVKPVKPAEPPEVVYDRLRRKALATSPEVLGMAGTLGENDPYGLLMEMGMAGGAVTLACFADGDARLFYQTGGGMVGGIAHDSVRKAAKELVVLAEKALPRMTPATSQPLPGPGKVCFYALTPRGTFSAETDREELADHSDFASLFTSGQEVVSQMRQVQTQKARSG